MLYCLGHQCLERGKVTRTHSTAAIPHVETSPEFQRVWHKSFFAWIQKEEVET